MHHTTRLLGRGWTFTQIGGEGTKNGEWLETSAFPTSVHVELLHLRKIPDPVSTASWAWQHDRVYSFMTVSRASRVGCTVCAT
jgi:beta-mannosidase